MFIQTIYPSHTGSRLLVLVSIPGDSGNKAGGHSGQVTPITHIHILQTILMLQSAYNTCHWTERGSWKSRRKPLKYGENMCTQGRGGNQTPNRGVARQPCEALPQNDSITIIQIEL